MKSFEQIAENLQRKKYIPPDISDEECAQQYYDDIILRHTEVQPKPEHRDPALFGITQERVSRIKISNYRAQRLELEQDIERLRILLAQSSGDDTNFYYDIYQSKMAELKKINSNIAYLKNLLAGNVDEKEKFDINRLKSIPIDQLVEVNAAGFFKIRDEDTPSVKWYKPTNRWTDFGTGESGDSIDLTMKLRNCDFYTACKYLSCG